VRAAATNQFEISMPYVITATSIGGPEVLCRKEFEPGSPGPNTVLIRHTAIGVNFIDVYYRTGLYPWPQDGDLVLGSEAAGVVEAVGRGVDDLVEGDRVAYTLRNGAYTTHRIVDTRHLVRIPDGVTDVVAAGGFLKGLTVYYLVNSSFAAKAGHVVLFHAAAGGVGLIAGQWLASLGVMAIGTAGGKEKCDIARRHGYAHVIDYRSEDFVQRVKDITDGEGVHAVYDSVGKDTYPGSLHCLRLFGKLINFGQSSGPALDFKLSDLAVGSYSVTRPILFHYTQNPAWLQRAGGELFELIRKGTLAIPVNQTFPLEQVAEAHRMVEGRKTSGSTVLTVADSRLSY
jgi:NADPH2:quinone reductase